MPTVCYACSSVQPISTSYDIKDIAYMVCLDMVCFNGLNKNKHIQIMQKLQVNTTGTVVSKKETTTDTTQSKGAFSPKVPGTFSPVLSYPAIKSTIGSYSNFFTC